MLSDTTASKKKLFFIVLVAALGYFVDIYDLVIFSIVLIQKLYTILIFRVLYNLLKIMRIGHQPVVTNKNT